MSSFSFGSSHGSSMHKHHYSILFATAIFFALIDQVTKQLAHNGTLYSSSDVFGVVATTNTGSLFSLFADTMYSNIIFIIISIIALIVLFFFGKHLGNSKKVSFILGLLMAGIAGNLIDRILHGAVLDWIAIGVWPVFNIADSCIVVGVILAVWHLWPKKKHGSSHAWH